MDEKRALTLCGGGAKGAYEIGAVRALYELGETFDIITGTSIGALTGAMLVQGDAEQLNRLWEGLSIRSVMTEASPSTVAGDAVPQQGRHRPLPQKLCEQKRGGHRAVP